MLRVNGDRLGVVLQEGTHRILLTHHARGFLPGVVAASLAACALLLGATQKGG